MEQAHLISLTEKAEVRHKQWDTVLQRTIAYESFSGSNNNMKS